MQTWEEAAAIDGKGRARPAAGRKGPGAAGHGAKWQAMSVNGAQAKARALLGLPRLGRPQLLKGEAADNTSAASEREVAIAVLSQLLERAAVRDKTARALALCNLTPRPSYSWQEAMLGSMPWRSTVALAKWRKKDWAAGPHPPRVSATIGTRVRPAAAHCWAVCLSSSLCAS